MKIKATGPVSRTMHNNLWRESRKLLKENVSLKQRVHSWESAHDVYRHQRDDLSNRCSFIEARLDDAEQNNGRKDSQIAALIEDLATVKRERDDASEKAAANEIKILRQLATEQAKSREYLRKSLALLRALILATEDGRWFSNMTDEEKAALPVTVEAFTSKHEAGGGLTASWTGSVESMASGHGRVAGNVAWQRREPNAKQE